MKATGIVRRIDDLGRVVIPKEIRRTMHIREGAPLEIFTDTNGLVIFKKYSPIGELSTFAAQYAEALAEGSEHTFAISDADRFIAVSGSGKKEISGKEIGLSLQQIIDERRPRFFSGSDAIEVTSVSRKLMAAAPIIAAGDTAGAVCIFCEDGKKIDDADIKTIQVAASFLGKQLED